MTMLGDQTQTVSTPPAPEPPRRTSTGRIIAGTLIVLFGAGWLADIAGWFELRWDLVLPTILIILGLGIMYGASRTDVGGLVVVGVILSLVVIVTGAIPATPWNGVGEILEAPDTLAELEATYEHGVGEMTIDFRQLEVTQDAEVEISLAVGSLTVFAPDNAIIDVTASAGIGEVTVLDETRSGFGPSIDRVDGFGWPTLKLDVSTGIGDVEVRR